MHYFEVDEEEADRLEEIGRVRRLGRASAARVRTLFWLRRSWRRRSRYVRRRVLTRRALAIGLTVLAFAAVGVAIVKLTNLFAASQQLTSARDQIEAGTTAIGVLIQLLLSVFIVVGLYLTWRRVEIAYGGQITERFTRAIDQLGYTRPDGSPAIEIRTGAVYALRRIAKDSAQDHWPIVEILASYVREQAPRVDREDSEAPSSMFKPRADIQAAIAAIGGRSRWRNEARWQVVDLSNSDLRGANLVRCHLKGANLSGSLLDRANFQSGTLAHADLSWTSGHFVIFAGCDLSFARLSSATVPFAMLAAAKLRHTHLAKSDLSGAMFWRSTVEDSDFSEAILKRADFSSGVFGQYRTLREYPGGPVLAGEAYHQALEGRAATFVDALSTPARLVRCFFKNADLSDADFTGVTPTDCRDLDIPGPE